MDERAGRRGTCGRSGSLTRVISQTGPGSLAHDRQFGVNAQCLGPAACTWVRAWLNGGVSVPAPQEDAAGRPTSQQTGGQTNNSHETRSSIHGGHERVRMLLPAFAGSKHPEKSTMPKASPESREASATRRRRQMSTVGDVCPGGDGLRARPAGRDGRWITRRSASRPPGVIKDCRVARLRRRTVRACRCDSSDYV
jgi:hypothetical protein